MFSTVQVSSNNLDLWLGILASFVTVVGGLAIANRWATKHAKVAIKEVLDKVADDMMNEVRPNGGTSKSLGDTVKRTEDTAKRTERAVASMSEKMNQWIGESRSVHRTQQAQIDCLHETKQDKT